MLDKISLIMNHNKACTFSKQKCRLRDLKTVWVMHGGHSCIQFNSFDPRKHGKAQDVVYSPFRIYMNLGAKYNRSVSGLF